MQEELRTFNKMTEMYAEDNVPWDDVLPPPEVIVTLGKMPAGRALDVGCGYGRAAIYMAKRGWQVDGIDFVPKAIETAKDRAIRADVYVKFQVGDMTDMPFDEPYDFVLDVGCGHGLMPAQWAIYHRELKRLLKPNALFLLFARLQPPHATEMPSVVEADLRTLFTNGFRLDKIEKGVTEMDDENKWQSAWLWFSRL